MAFLTFFDDSQKFMTINDFYGARRSDIESKFEFINKFNELMSSQNLENIWIFHIFLYIISFTYLPF